MSRSIISVAATRPEALQAGNPSEHSDDTSVEDMSASTAHDDDLVQSVGDLL